METGREEKKEKQEQISVETSITVVGKIYEKQPIGPKGGMIEVAIPTEKELQIVLRGKTFEFFENEKPINRFEFKGKAKNSQLNSIVTVLKDIEAFDKPKDARRWIVEKNIFDTLSKLKEELDKKRKEKYEKDLTKKYELKVVKPDISKDISKQALTFFACGREDEGTEIITAKIEDEEYIKTLRDDKSEEIWIYQRHGFNEGIYIPNGKTYIQERCRKILGDAYSSKIYKNVIDKIKADTFIEAKEFFEEEHIDLIAVQNGILNLKTKKIIPFSPDYKFFSKHPIIYIEGKDCPTIKRFFKSLFKDEDEIKVMQELFGFLLYREYFLEKAFMFLGSGRNGKGKTIMLMKKFLGAENTSEIPLDDLEKDMYALGEVFKKNANLAGDLSRTALRKSGKFKSLTGRDPVTAARKYLSRLPFINYAKMIFACNELPFTYDLTDAFFDRWIIIDFPFRFLPEKEIKADVLNQNENIKIQDPKIIDKIATPEELTGLLNWALEGLDRLFENKSFSFSPSTSETRNVWLRKSDSCLAFVMDYIEEDYESYILKSDFKAKYTMYCRKHKSIISDDKKILEIITTTAGGSDDRKSVDIEGSSKQRAVWSGIRFKDAINSLLENKPISKGREGRGGKSESISHIEKESLQNTPSRLTTLTNYDEKKSLVLPEKYIIDEEFVED